MDNGFVWMLWALPLLASVSAAICLRAPVLGKRLNLIDSPDEERKLHARPTPLLGGLAVTVPFALAVVMLALAGQAPSMLLVLTSLGLSFVLLGLLDDRRRMDALARLATSVAVVALLAPTHDGLVLQSLAFSFLDQPLSLGVFAVAFTALVVVGLVNAVNMTDGMNGLLPGLWLIWTVGFLTYTPVAWLPLAMLVFASLVIVLAFNLRGRLFLGDAGSYGAGALVGFSAIALYNEPAVYMPADVAVAWFLIPVADCLRVMVLRVLNGSSPMQADCGHLHHRMARRMSRRTSVLSYWGLVALPVAATAFEADLAPAAIIIAGLLYGSVLIFTADRRPMMSAKREAGH